METLKEGHGNLSDNRDLLNLKINIGGEYIGVCHRNWCRTIFCLLYLKAFY